MARNYTEDCLDAHNVTSAILAFITQNPNINSAPNSQRERATKGSLIWWSASIQSLPMVQFFQALQSDDVAKQRIMDLDLNKTISRPDG